MNNNKKYARTIDYSRHQQIIQELNEQIAIMKQQINEADQAAFQHKDLQHAHEQLLDQYTDLQSTNLSLYQDKDKLLQQINMLQTVNLNVQYQFAALQSKRITKCQHIYQCGCGMS